MPLIPTPITARFLTAGPLTAAVRAPQRTALLQVAKTGAAVALSWFIAGAALRVELPIFGAIAALLVVQPSVNQSFGRAVERSLGVIAGVLVALGLSLLFGRPGWLLLVAVLVVLLGAWAVRLNPAAANQAAISALLVLALGATTPQYALDRILETLIGAVIGVVINLAIAPPVLLVPAHRASARLAGELADALDRLAGAFAATPPPGDLLTQARSLRQGSHAAKTALQAGRDSLTFNPRRRRLDEKLRADDDLYARLEPIVTQVIGMTRTVHDHGVTALADGPLGARIAEECRRAAHDLRLLADRAPGASAPPAADLSLTSPIAVLDVPPAEWVVAGALLEDLRRVREEIVADTP
ncbi:aromatic acid exporter family protein [uncultured Amnibacterium sp.]|uniref:FUSC family protein n=1 Tax=uncultured Amnibacterium sp. TaxID=1631851 RepID=UPI0035C9AF05